MRFFYCPTEGDMYIEQYKNEPGVVCFKWHHKILKWNTMCRLTAVGLIWLVGAVIVAITQEVSGDALAIVTCGLARPTWPGGGFRRTHWTQATWRETSMVNLYFNIHGIYLFYLFILPTYLLFYLYPIIFVLYVLLFLNCIFKIQKTLLSI